MYTGKEYPTYLKKTFSRKSQGKMSFIEMSKSKNILTPIIMKKII